MEAVCVAGAVIGTCCLILALVALFEEEYTVLGASALIGVILLLLCVPSLDQIADGRSKVRETVQQEQIQVLMADKWSVYYADKEKTILVKDNTVLSVPKGGPPAINPPDVKIKGVTPSPEKPVVAEKKQ